jgi:hypothetical protein
MITPEDVLLSGKVDLYAVATGAGTNLLTQLWSTPGASAYLKGFHFPYDPAETDDFLGFQPGHYCDEKAAIFLAMEAFIRARKHYYRNGHHLKPETVDRKAIGLALTASVASKTAHRGDHRAYVATISNFMGPPVTAGKVVLEKGIGLIRRVSDDLIASQKAVDEIMHLVVDGQYSMPSFTEAFIKDLIFVPPYPFKGDASKSQKNVYIPGNFNPLHESHIKMGEILRDSYGLRPVYSICIDPPHKPPLSLIDMLDRRAMFRALAPESGLLFTREDPLFIGKMQGRPYANWAVGADTLDRLLDPKWGPSTDDVCEVINQTGSKIFFFPSKDGSGGYIDTPSIMTKYKSDKLADLLHNMQIFRVGTELPSIRSTDIRAAAGR